MQASRVQDGLPTFVDIYLYNDKPKTRLIQRWHFNGLWRDPETTIHVPKSLIFPLQEAEMQGIPLRVPAKAEEVCAFLYGPSWRTPARKGAGYEMKIVDSRPQFIQ
ncbi:MAG: hypothetical protein EpisKO_01520 [Epibacterium sp.]